MSAGWYTGNGSSRIVLIKKGDTGTPYPRDNNTYIPDSQFGKGSQIDTSGWYCVHKSTDNSFYSNRDTITGLEPNTTYRIMVIEYNGSEGDEKYLLATAENNPVNQSTRPGVAGFIETISFSRPRTTSFSYSILLLMVVYQ
jgi:hypothetical protein